MLRKFSVVVFSLALIGLIINCTNQADKKAKNEINPGEKLYNSLCTSCHGLKGNLKLSGAADLKVSKLTVEEMAEIISNGKGSMPSFKKYLTEEQIKDISEYSISLRK